MDQVEAGHPDGFGTRAAEQGPGRTVDPLHDAVGVDHDDRVGEFVEEADQAPLVIGGQVGVGAVGAGLSHTRIIDILVAAL